MDFSNQQKIEEWVQNLPLGDARLSAKAIYSVLKELNNGGVKLRHHLDFLERISPNVYNILSNLEKSYVNAHFPLQPRPRNAVRMADSLCEMLIRNYHNILIEISSHDLGKTTNDPREQIWLQVAHRILYYSHRILVNQITLELDSRNNFWLRIFNIYRSSRKLPNRKRKIDCSAIPDYPIVCVKDLITRIFLISLIPMHSLRSAQIIAIFRTISFWCSLTRVSTYTADTKYKKTHFKINIKHDRGPVPAPEINDFDPDEKCVLLDTSQLKIRITELCDQAKQQIEVTLETGDTIPLSLLNQLSSFWSIPPKRESDRTKCNEIIEILISINSIYNAQIDKIEKEEQARKEKELAKARALSPKNKAAPVNANITSDLSRFDVIGQPVRQISTKLAYASPKSAKISSNLNHDSPSEDLRFTLISATVKDQSQTGYRLELKLHNELRMHVGDLISIRYPDEEESTIAVIRWIKQLDQGRISIGVLVIARNPVIANYRTGASSNIENNQKCLIAEHVHSQKTLMIFNHVPMIRKKLLTLHYEDEQFPIAFKGAPLEESRSFDAFEFGIRRGDKNEPDPKLPILDMILLQALVHKEEKPENQEVIIEETDIDDSLWSLE